MTRCPTASARNSSRLGVTAPRAPGGAVTVMRSIVARPTAAPSSDITGPRRGRMAGMAAPEQTGAGPPRGRRPGGDSTRAQLLDAARAEFAERGYEGATVRAIADRAGVDPAMVNH